METNCIFCKIIAGTMPSYTIYEDDYCLAFLDIHPSDNGHTLVIPKKHVVSLGQADIETIKNVAIATKNVRNLLAEKLNPKGFNFVTNDGKEAFQEVFHYHQHIIPKYHKTEGYTPGRHPFPKKPIENMFQLIKKH